MARTPFARAFVAGSEGAQTTAVFDLPWTTLEGRGTFPRVRAWGFAGPRFRFAAFAAFGAVLVAAVLFATVGTAHAAVPEDARDAGDTRARAEAMLKSAELDDEAFAFGRALARYDEGRALDPGSRLAPRAEARAAMLRAHAEGDFAPYVKLERVRREPALSSDPRAIEELVREAESFPSGLVRVEVWVLAAEAFAHRFDRPADAEALLRRVVIDPKTDPVVAQKAARDLVMLRLARRDLAGAEEAAHLAGARADATLLRDVERSIRRRSLHRVAIGALVVMIALAGRALYAATRRAGGATRLRAALAGTWRVALGYAAYIALGGAMLASGYEAGTSKPFLYFGVVLVPIVLLARAWAASGAAGRAARSGRAVLCGAAALAAAFLVLETVEVAFLEGMGL